MKFWSRKKVKKEIREAVRDTNRFTVIVLGVLLAMLPVIAAVFGGFYLADYAEDLGRMYQGTIFLGLIVVIALLSFYDVKKRLHIGGS